MNPRKQKSRKKFEQISRNRTANTTKLVQTVAVVDFPTSGIWLEKQKEPLQIAEEEEEKEEEIISVA